MHPHAKIIVGIKQRSFVIASSLQHLETISKEDFPVSHKLINSRYKIMGDQSVSYFTLVLDCISSA